MAYLLHIESATKTCSVALSEDDRTIVLIEENTPGYSHSGMLTIFIKDALSQAGITAKDLAAVSVSKGPGSYTGLRIGVSAAKGLCYGLDIPMIAVDTPEAMANHCRKQLLERIDLISPDALEAIYCPMIDARRMEVYTCLYDYKLLKISDIEAIVINQDSFSDLLDGHKIVMFGDGANKCKELLTRRNAVFFDDIGPSAAGLAGPAFRKYVNREFVDLAYFEPFYLKDFVAGKPKVKGL